MQVSIEKEETDPRGAGRWQRGNVEASLVLMAAMFKEGGMQGT